MKLCNGTIFIIGNRYFMYSVQIIAITLKLYLREMHFIGIIISESIVVQSVFSL